MANILPEAVTQFVDSNGQPYAGGFVYFYIPSTTTPKATYQDAAQTILNSNPIVLDGAGRAIIFGSGAYRQQLYDVNMNLVWDQLTYSAPSTTDLSNTGVPGGAGLIGFDGTTLDQQFKTRVERVCSNIAALRTISKTTYNYAFVEGYYTPGDGSEGSYWYDSSDTTSADNGGTVIVAADGGRWKLLHEGTIWARQFGAKGNSVADDTTSLQNFISVISAGGYIGELGSGVFNVSSPLTASSAFTLNGTIASEIHNTNATATPAVISLSSGANTGTILSGFKISSVTTSTCSGVQTTGGYALLLDRLNITSTYKGIVFTGAQIGATIRDCYVQNTSNYGYHIDAGNMTIKGSYAINCGSAGFYFSTVSGASAGIVLDHCTAAGSGWHSFVFQGSNTAGVQDAVVTGCVSSTSPNGSGFFWDSYSKNNLMTGCLVEVAGVNSGGSVVSDQPGIHFTQNNHAISITGCQSTFCSGSGIQMDCGNFEITGGHYIANNIIGQPSYAGILVGPAGAVDAFAITGINAIPKSGPDSNTQAFGINLFGTGHTNGSISGCILSGTTGPLGIQGSPGVIVTACPGYVNVNRGVTNIPASTSSYVINHGLTGTPATVIASFSGGSAGSINLFTTTYNPTSFTLGLTASSGSVLQVTWEAHL